MARAQRLSRRELLVGALALTLGAGCSSGPPPSAASPSTAAGSPDARPGGRAASAGPPSAVSTSTPSPSRALPEVVAWRPRGDEQSADLKLLATGAVEALGAVASGAPVAGGAGVAAAADRLRAAGAEPRLARQAAALVPPGAPAVTQVVYPQYGGLLVDSASVMVVVRQSWQTGDGVAEREVVADVRLLRRGGRWRVAEVRPALGRPVDLAAVSREARAVLQSPRLSLPDPARVDVATLAQRPLLTLLASLARAHDLAVTTLRSGHPREVFGTLRDSNHWGGRAVDIWQVDGVPVVQMPPDDPRLRALLERARALGANEIGSPADPDGRGRVFFANALHRDHVHLGFDP